MNSASFAQQPRIYLNQLDFVGDFVNGVIPMVDRNPNGVDYIFNPNPIQDFIINFDNVVTVSADVEIQIAPTINIIVDGVLIAESAHIDVLNAIGNWGAIVVRGNDQPCQIDDLIDLGFGNGTAEFNNSLIQYGGTSITYNSMFSLTSWPGENDPQSSPLLKLINGTIIRNSSSNGIRAFRGSAEWRPISPTVELDNGHIAGPNIPNINGHGIVFDDTAPSAGAIASLRLANASISGCSGHGVCHLNIPEGPFTQFLVNIEDSQILSSKGSGVFINAAERYHALMNLTVENSQISGNIEDPNANPPVAWAGYGIAVAGIYNPASSVFVTNSSQIHNNGFGGVRIEKTRATTEIRDCHVFQNGSDALEQEQLNTQYQTGNGIRIFLVQPICSVVGSSLIEGCEIYENGHAGIQIQRRIQILQWINAEPEAMTAILGNTLTDNATAVDIGGGIDATDPREGASIHIMDDVWRGTIIGNQIVGGVSGICWDCQDVDGRSPLQGRIRNNIQKDAAYGMVFRRTLSTIDVDFELNFATHAYNNVFWDNSIAGIWIAPNVWMDDLLDGIQIQSNLIGQSNVPGVPPPAGERIGILNEAGGPRMPFGFNAFWQNNWITGEPMVDPGWPGLPINLPITTITADPKLVNPADVDPLAGFHLYWNSPLINRGVNENPGGILQMAFCDDPNDPNNPDSPWWVGDPKMPSNDGILRDNSQNDIGLFGGVPAAGITAAMGYEPDTYGFDPYCRIDAQNSVLTNLNLPSGGAGDRDWLENDYYRAYSSITTPDGQEFDIGQNGQVAGAAYFEFTDPGNPIGWTVNGTLRANGNPGLDEPKTIYFASQNAQPEEWDRIYLYKPDGTCIFNGCDVGGSGKALFFSQYMTDLLRLVQVQNCRIHDATSTGIYVAGHFKLECKASLIENTGSHGIQFSNSETLFQNEISLIEDTEIRYTCKDGFTSQGGIYCYQANPMIRGTFIHDNQDYGIYISTSANPAIQGVVNQANNIMNNGPDDPDNPQVYGAEIRLSVASSMDADEPITWCNLYDIREAQGVDFRHGYLVASASINDLDVFNNYYGDDIEADEPRIDNLERPVDLDDDDEDFSSPDGGIQADFIIGNDQLVDDKWDEVDDAPIPENEFEEALFAMRAGNLEEACETLREWIADEPATPQAGSAVRILTRIERSLGSDLNRLRSELLRLADNSRENYPDLGWEAEKSAVRCLIYQDDYESAIRELNELREHAPDELEEVEIDIEIELAEVAIQAGNLDAVGSHEEAISYLQERIEDIHAERARKLGRGLIAGEFRLTSVYPNPFNSTLKIEFTLPKAATVEFSIFDISGRTIETRENAYNAGLNRLSWDASDLPAGLYYLEANYEGRVERNRMVLIK